MLRVRMFGGTEVRRPDGRVLGLKDFGGVKPRELFEILVLHRGRVLSKEVLADLLWEGSPPRDAVGTVESYVSVLRKKLAPGLRANVNPVGTVPGGYRLDDQQASVDLDEVDALLTAASRRGPAETVHLVRRALDLARGEVLEHLAYARWAQTARRTWQHRIVGAAVRGAEAALWMGDAERALGLARRALQGDVLAEDAWRLVIRAHWAAGRRGEALRAYEACRRELSDAVGVDPSPETQQLFQALLQSDAAAAGATTGAGAELDRAVAALVALVQRANQTSPEGVDAGTGASDAALVVLEVLRRAGVPVVWAWPPARSGDPPAAGGQNRP